MKYYFKITIPVMAFLIMPFSILCQIDTTEINKLFEMSLSDLMNQEVVTSARFVQRSAETASSVSVITSDDIRNFHYATLGEALNSQCGFYLSNDKNYLYVGSRGFSRPTDYNNRIIIMLDGHIMNEVVYGSAFMGNELGINLKNVEKIEIVKGPGASLYGSGAMLNVVNIIMKKGARTDGLQVSAGTGSYGKHEVSALFGKQSGKFDISVSGTGGVYKGENYYFQELDKPETNNGISSGMDWEKYYGLQAKASSGNLTFSGVLTSRLKGIPTGAFNTDITGDVSTTDNRFFLEAGYRKELNKNSSVFFRLYYDDYYYTGSYPSGGNECFEASYGHWAGSEIQYNLKTGNRNIIVTGVEYRKIFRSDYKEWNNSETFFYKNSPFSFFSLYLHDQFTIVKKLNLTAGLRYDHYSIFGQAASPRLALVYEYSDASSVKLLYSEAFRIPNMYESFYQSENVHVSNPGIKPEKIRSFEIAWGHKINENIYGSISAYYFRIHNLIDLTYHEEEDLTEFINLGKAHASGIETELRYRPANRGGGYINFSLQEALDAESHHLLTNSPELLVRAGWSYPVAGKVFISPEFFYESGRKTLAGNKTDEVFLFNLTLRTARFLKYFDISFKARNLLNQKYYYPGGYEHVQDALIQDSRNFLIQLTAKF